MPAPGDLAVSDLDTPRVVIATLRDQLARTQRDNAALRHQLDVLCRRLCVATHPQAQIAQLTPRGWAETFGPPRA